MERRAAFGVREAQRRGVEEEARDAESLAEQAVMAALAMVYVAHQRMADMRHVAADLVHSPGERLDVRERITGRRIATYGNGELDAGEAAEARARLSGLFARLLDEGVVDVALIREIAADNGEVRFLHEPLREQVGDSARSFGVEREEEDARRASVQAMDGINPAAEAVSEDRHAGVAIAGFARAVHEKAARLGDGDEARVAVEDLNHREGA